MSQETTAHITKHTTLTQALKGWEFYLKDQSSSPHTITAFLGDMRLLLSFLPPDQTLGEITLADLNNFLDWMQNERDVPCSPKTLARRITTLKSFFRWLHEGGVIAVNPAEKVVQKSVRSPLPEVLTPEEVNSLLETASRQLHAERAEPRAYTLFALLLHTGIKKGECTSLSPNHVHIQDSGSFIFVRYASPQNRYKERKISIPDSWITAYRVYQEHFPLTDQLFPWSARMLEYALENLGEDADLDKRVSFSMCRWTSALIDWRAGTDHNKIRQKLGISEVQWREVSRKIMSLSKQIDEEEQQTRYLLEEELSPDQEESI